SPCAATVNGGPSLDGVTPTLTYYPGSSASGTPLAGAPVAAGTYTVVAAFAGSADYTSATSAPLTFTIAKADAVISVTGYDVTYDGTAHTAGGTATGVNGESLSGLDLSGTGHSNAGSYTDAWTFTDSTGNYNDASGAASDRIAR